MTGNKIRNLIIVIAFFVCVSVPAYAAETLIFSDTFTDSTGTELSAHTPDTGTSWQEIVDTLPGAFMEVRNDAAPGARANSSGNLNSQAVAYVANPASSVPDMRVEVTLNQFPTSTDDIAAIIVRVQDANNFYAFFLHTETGTTRHVWLQKVISGVSTLIVASSEDPTIVAGDVISLEAVGTTITARLNGEVVLSGSDSAISSAGKAGIYLGAYDDWTDADISLLYRFDDFKVYEITSDTERRIW